jgi:hypothetical protein
MSWLRQIWKSRYVCMLESEVARLRAENRAMLNSLLGTAGFGPVESGEGVKQEIVPRLRKRSWQQIQRLKEDEAARP